MLAFDGFAPTSSGTTAAISARVLHVELAATCSNSFDILHKTPLIDGRLISVPDKKAASGA